MGYKELKKHVKLGLSFDHEYLDKQIDILDEELALFGAFGLVIENKEMKTQVLDSLIKIREELNSSSKPKTNGR